MYFIVPTTSASSMPSPREPTPAGGTPAWDERREEAETRTMLAQAIR